MNRLCPFLLSLVLVMLAPLGFAGTHSVVLDEVSVPTRGTIEGGFTTHGDFYAFGSMEEDHGGLWMTDGTTLGTWQVNEDEVAGPKISAPPYLYYWSEEAIYRTDGSPGQRTLILEDAGSAPDFEDALTGARGSSAHWLKQVGATWELWQSDGQENDARVIAELPRGPAPIFAGLMQSRGQWLVFLAPDSESRTTALWSVNTAGDLHLLDTAILNTQSPFFVGEHVYYTKRTDGQIRLFRSGESTNSATEVLSSGEDDYRTPTNFLVDGDTLYFQANTPAHGNELWTLSSEGTATLLVDLLAGRNSSSPEPLAVFQNAVWAMARVGGASRLWQIPLDASEAPSQVEGLDDEIDDHYFHEAHALGEQIFLVSSPTQNSDERWLTRTDGLTERGTEVLEDGWLTESAATDAGWPYLYPLAEAVLFPSFKGTVGSEPHTWLAEEDKPSLVKDAHNVPINGARTTVLQGTPGSADIQYFTITSEDETELRRLRTNGSIQTLRSKEAIDFGYSLTANFVTGTTFFVDRQGLWSLLTNASTPALIFENNTSRPEVTARHIPFTTTDRGILFLASLTGGLNFNIYHNDGFVGGETEIFGFGQQYFDVPLNFQNLTYYVINDVALSIQPRTTNGLTVDRFATFPARVALLGQTDTHLYFTENSTIWSYDGSTGFQRAGAPASISPLRMPPAADSKDRLFYVGRDESDDELWVTEGTEDDAERLTDIQDEGESGAFAHLTTIDDVLFFAGREESTGFELWRSEGTAEDTIRLTDLNAGEEDSIPDEPDMPMMGALGSYVYFAANDGVHGTELWRVHESGSPIELVQDLLPGAGSGYPHNFNTINGRLFFQASDPSRKLTVLREIVDDGLIESPFEATSISIEQEGEEVELRFGAGLPGSYFLLESSDLIQWRATESYTGPQAQTLTIPLDSQSQRPRYFRLQRN